MKSGKNNLGFSSETYCGQAVGGEAVACRR